MATVLDYSAGVPQAAAVRDAGYDGAVRYISPPRADWMRGKPIQRAEIDDFHVHGLDVAFVWQYGKEADSDVMRMLAPPNKNLTSSAAATIPCFSPWTLPSRSNSGT